MLPVSYAFVGGKSTMYCVGMCIGRLGARRWLEGKGGAVHLGGWKTLGKPERLERKCRLAGWRRIN